MDTIPQRDEAWLKSATPDQIVAALDAGELNTLMGEPAPPAAPPAEGQITEDQLKKMTPTQIGTAYEAGQLAELFGRFQRGT